ncbi:zeta toxin family protein [Capnocytophaga sp. ARDL2]|uniref:zeta toxin family protein n=1 Tax=Capnocytophaga sp. ARDL2 TaxID=3238809 RepID=UPI003558A3A6
MDLHKLKEIYEFEKIKLLKGLERQEKPLAFILGGQPASGKSKLGTYIQTTNSDKQFLFVNGDVYRDFHPNAMELKKAPQTFSEKTQIFSNFFTEELIKEAIKNKYNIIVEGTMRNPQVPLNTAKMFKENGFHVEALAISSPSIFTELGLYVRYQEEIEFQGYGRLADINSYYSAVEGIGKSLDALYNEKAVDKIHLHSYQGKEHLVTYSLENNEWNKTIFPSEELYTSREQQLKNKEIISDVIKRGDVFFPKMEIEIKKKVLPLLEELEKQLEKLQQQDKPRGFKR